MFLRWKQIHSPFFSLPRARREDVDLSLVLWCFFFLPKSRGGNQARLAILFSGGLDCTVLAFLADQSVPFSPLHPENISSFLSLKRALF